MKRIGLVIIVFLSIASTIATIISVLTGRYLDDFNNIKSLNNKTLFMDGDFINIEKMRGRNAALNEQKRFDIWGNLKSDSSYITINARDPKFLDLTLKYQPLLKSKLTGRYFVKTDNNEYYEGIYRALYFSVFLKGFFMVMMGFVVFYLVKYFKNRKYIL